MKQDTDNVDMELPVHSLLEDKTDIAEKQRECNSSRCAHVKCANTAVSKKVKGSRRCVPSHKREYGGSSVVAVNVDFYRRRVLYDSDCPG
eukprot:9636178-Heterocapsa_arctica.AAC.1